MKLTHIRFFAGLSLVELMVALGLGAFLSIGVLQLYSSNRSTSRIADAISEVQDNSRFVLDTISADIRMAGYRGCRTRSTLVFSNVLNDNQTLLNDYEEPLQGFNVNGTLNGELATALLNQPQPIDGSSVIVLRSAVSEPVDLLSYDSDSLTAELIPSLEQCPGTAIPRRSGLCPGDVALVSDCMRAAVFNVTALETIGTELKISHGAATNSTSNWGNDMTRLPQFRFDSTAEVIRVQTTIYYVGDNNGQLALFRKIDDDDAVPIADGIASIRVLYGEDTDSPRDYIADQYVAASDTLEWKNISTMRVEVLISSTSDNVSSQSMTVPFGGNQFAADDKRLYRQAITSTVLRNKSI